ncbi:hypothetical protein BDR26DRAFT_935285 [Obelidium mucronatum]|nr:hypothetical protein BDR26DRAFT_935285 [Obelidium mucronatum]
MNTIENPVSVDEVGEISTKFIELKRDSHQPEKPQPDDSIVQDVIDFGSLTILDIATEHLTCVFEPDLEIDLTIVIARPPAFPQERESKLDRIGVHAGNTSRKYKEFPPLNRSSRNAKTVEFFRK